MVKSYNVSGSSGEKKPLERKNAIKIKKGDQKLDRIRQDSKAETENTKPAADSPSKPPKPLSKKKAAKEAFKRDVEAISRVNPEIASMIQKKPALLQLLKHMGKVQAAQQVSAPPSTPSAGKQSGRGRSNTI